MKVGELKFLLGSLPQDMPLVITSPTGIKPVLLALIEEFGGTELEAKSHSVLLLSSEIVRQ